MGTLTMMGKKRGAFGSLTFLSVKSCHSTKGLRPKLIPVMETPGFKAAGGAIRGKIADRKWCGCMGEKEGLHSLADTFYSESALSACFPSVQPDKEPLADLIHTQGPASGTRSRVEHNQSNQSQNRSTSPVPLGVIYTDFLPFQSRRWRAETAPNVTGILAETILATRLMTLWFSEHSSHLQLSWRGLGPSLLTHYPGLP